MFGCGAKKKKIEHVILAHVSCSVYSCVSTNIYKLQQH